MDDKKMNNKGKIESLLSSFNIEISFPAYYLCMPNFSSRFRLAMSLPNFVQFVSPANTPLPRV